uniref:Laminin, alpha 1 n=1 Tax=Oncorhynchus tshawytscha TaxID=74940 RepID=A0A8C8JW27_ONCTS
MSWSETPSLSLPGLFPAILNLASNAEITTNATCGEPEPEMYCKLVEHVPGRRIRNSQCRTCNAQSQNPKEQHPITNAIDGTNGWWQSPSIKNGRQFHLVTITLDLRQIFQVAYIIIKAANSPRPGNWVLERSMDGVEFTPWQYYAISDTECLTRYNITPRFGPPTYKRDDEVICTSYYSRLVPLEHGEIHTSLINGRPSADQLTPELLDFTSARYIRLRLQRIRTLNADLMTLSYRDPKEVDPIVTRRYYYSIKDISVGGMCICYGHAQSCPWDPVAKKLQCVCEHNTCGESCNECCPGYHQEPWQPGTLSNGNTCEKCNCHNKAEDCYYNQTMDDHKMSMNSHGHFHGGGVCIDCTQNTAGVNCETCADGFYRPHEVLSPHCPNPCVECGCDMRGSLTPTCIRDDNHAKLEKGQCLCKEGFVGEHCERCAFGYRDFPLCSRCECSLEGSLNIDPCTECICKENVMGANCDLCKQGFYNLEDRNPEGCTECFCFGVSDVCESSPWEGEKDRGSNYPRGPDFTSIFSVTNFDYCIFTLGNVFLSLTLYFYNFPLFVFSHCFVKLTSYGGLLNYTVAYDVSVDNVDNSLPSQFDLIIEGNGRTLRQTPPKQLFLTPLREQLVSVELLPQGFVDVHTGQRVDRDELMTVLADLAGLRIRGHLNASAEGALRLSTVSLDMADIRAANPVQARDVEQCECPWGYLGTSCEVNTQFCSSGFYRVGGILFGGNCLQCECNDHATECDINGVCLDCTHNTTGPHCNQCLPGYYGDTSEGTPEDCQRCACPLIVATNNFSPTCLLEGPGQVTCDQCQQGYTGTKCERCANGYHGDPNVAGKECVLCECNGNVDPWDPGHCDTSSGVCLKCHSHTSGDDCERCEDGYYGDAITAKNCQACSCHGNGSYSAMCDLLTGQCTCKPNVVGEKCDQCQVGFHSLLSGQGCRDCNCSQSGSVSTACEEEGRCQCIPGVAGDKCDRCYHGYFNYQDRGCTQCECAHTHGNCNATTGKCICPPHTIGEKCELCEEGHWGHDTVAGCKSCDCSEAGSSATQCDLTNGQCLCRPDFARQKCDQCTMGYRGYPECTACNCNINGTREEFCDKELGLCSCEAPGNCVCKDNVGGGGCDECKKGSFGLSGPNPDGCSPCFCFGVSSDCEELGGMVRVPRDPQGSVEGVYYQASDMLLDTREKENITLPGPYYWRLPKHYQGNKLLSYGGKLSYMVAFYALDGAGLANYEPQVLMRGGHLGKKVIYIDMPAPDNRVKTRQDVPLTEHKWKYFNSVSEKAVSHSDFLAVLSNIEYITIKASYGTGLQQSRISNITMDTALEAEEGSEGLEVACLIETCECPAGYAGLSCQECSPGYYRQPVTDLNLRGKRPLIQPCVPCQCNNHSQACDLDTGECLGCQHNTAGEHCNVCGSGYYGNVKGSVSDCSLCACPLKENSFSPTCAMEGVMGDFRCNACKPGYEGRYCERCSVGYYGNPSGPGGKCEACQCSTAGSLHLVCDSLKGQCECKAGVRGHLCDQCEARHVLDGDQCVSCDDECTGVLLDDLDALESSFLSVNLTGVILSPYSTLVSLENDTREVKNLMSWESSPAYHLNRVEEDLTNLTQDIDGLLRQATGLSADGEEVAQSTENSVTQGAKFLEYIITIHTAIQGTANSNRTTCITMFLYSILGFHRKCITSKYAHLVNNLMFCDIEQYFIMNLSCLLSLSASTAESKLKEAESRTERLYDRLKPLKTLGENLSRNLSEIREMINQARKQAASIKVAVLADKNCVRAYTPEVSSSNFNTLTMTVKTSEPDNLLFYMGSSSSVDFMAVEMQHGKVAYLWDTGSGHAKLEYPDVQINNNKWHHINATRFGRHGTLSVHQLESEPLPAVKTTSPGSATILEVNKSTLIFVGGLGGQIKSSVVKMTQFKGCMGEASLNEKNIGLWNYAEREGQCRGCFMSPQTEETSFHFDGSGYSVVEKPLRSTSTSIVMLFKTLSPNGLLLYLASNGTVRPLDFLSIELVEGQVRLTFELGSGPLTLTSNKAYNTGSWYKITLQRNKRKGGKISEVNCECNYFCRRQVVARSYVGCIKNMEIARSNFDLLRDSYGVKKGCVLEVRKAVVSVLREGYVELPSVSLDPQGELLASFSTRNDTGIILAGFSKAGTRKSRQARQVRPQIYFMLISGRLEVHVNMAEGGSVHKVVVKSRSGSFSDGQEHSVILQRNRKMLVVLVDEDHQEMVRLSSEKASLTLTSLYMGGVPPGEGAGQLRTTSSFYGCIRNLLKYFMSLLASLRDSFSLELSVRTYTQSGLIYYMAHANQMDYATLQLLGGHLFFTCDKGSGPATATFPVPVNDGQWHTVSDYALLGQERYLAGCIQKVLLNSVKLNTQSPVSEQSTAYCFTAAQDGTFFNGSGYAALIKNGYKVGSDMEVSLEFRSTVSDGVLLGVSSAKVDAIGLELANGQAVFHVNNGAGRVSATSRLGWWLCDGLWHTLLAKKTKNALSLTVDGVTVLTDNPHPQSTSAETKDPVYVGGFPVGVKQNCLTSRMPFRGCMRNIRLIKGHMTNILDFSTAFTLHGVSPHSCPSTAT